MVLPLRLCLEGTNHRSREATFAHTVDISPVGAQFRVIWTKQVGPDELRAGVESVAIENNFWGLELSTPAQMGDHSNPSSDTSFATWLRQFK
jgi:hypothetical protein